jgi:23S rRNA pseudouridine2605 synthase
MRHLRARTHLERRVGLARALSKQGMCSRSVAAELILAGRVRLDGVIVRDPEAPTTAHSRIAVDGERIAGVATVYVMLNKPRGLVTTTRDEQGRDTVYRCFQDSHLPWIGPVGRLDQASEGLLLFSNDPEWAAALLAPESHVSKTYHLQIEGIPSPRELQRMIEGIPADDGEVLQVDSARVLRHGERNAWLEIALHEGKNRHLRRLCTALGHPVLRLVRIAIGTVELGDLAKGAWRRLTPEEIRSLDQRPQRP